MIEIILLIFAYLLGSLSTAIIACKILGLPDPRTQGSGNAGATNVLRMGEKKLAVIVLIGDLLKGLIPVLIAKFLIPNSWIAWIGLAAILGHMYPVFFQFKGGKGVATGAGVLLVLSWPLGICVLLTWIVVFYLSRYSSLGAIIATSLMPVYAIYFSRESLVALILIALLILYKHYDNIKRLLNGTESKFREK